MKLKLSNLQDVCVKLSSALDSDGINTVTNALGLVANASENKLQIALTNYEYYITATVDTIDNEEFNATVTADVFFKLISQLSTEFVELSIVDEAVVISANGKYKLPMIFEDDVLLKIPPLSIDTVEKVTTISKANMLSILTYNSKELLKGETKNPVQKLYYLDGKGCITFTTGACVNDFAISEDVPTLLSPKIVNLFKVFTEDNINWTFGNSTISGVAIKMLGIADSGFQVITRVPSNNTLINTVPKDVIREMAVAKYPYSVVLNKEYLSNAIERLLVFMPRDMYPQPYGKFEFTDKGVTIYDKLGVNVETLTYLDGSSALTDTITVVLDFRDIKTTLDAVKDETITLKFGNEISILIQYSHLTNVIPECVA